MASAAVAQSAASSGIPAKDVFAPRDMRFLSPSLSRACNWITLKLNTQPVGSFRYEVFRYFSDVDFMERVVSGYTRADAIRRIAVRLTLMAQRIRTAAIAQPGVVFFSEMKCGLDERYRLHGLGHWTFDTGGAAHLRKFRPKLVQQGIRQLEENGLISSAEATEWLKAVVPRSSTFVQWDKMRRLYRKYFFLRWSLDEILCNEKQLPKGVTVTLQQALAVPSHTKVDIFGWVDGRYMELSNNFFFTWMDRPSPELASRPWLDVDVLEVQVDSSAKPFAHPVAATALVELEPHDQQLQHAQDADHTDTATAADAVDWRLSDHEHLVSASLDDFEQAVNFDIAEYASSGNPLKAAKRLFVLGRWKKQSLDRTLSQLSKELKQALAHLEAVQSTELKGSDVGVDHGNNNKRAATSAVENAGQRVEAARQALAQAEKEQDTVQTHVSRVYKVAPLFQSRAAYLAQASSDMKTLISLLSLHGSSVPLKNVMRHVLRLHKQVINGLPLEQVDKVHAAFAGLFEAFEGAMGPAASYAAAVPASPSPSASSSSSPSKPDQKTDSSSSRGGAYEAVQARVVAALRAVVPVLDAEVARVCWAFFTVHDIRVDVQVKVVEDE